MSNTQFGRKASLIVSTGTQGLDLSDFRFTFRTTNSDAQTPNTLYVRVYNLSSQTVAKIGTEFNTVTLQAGYESSYGVIFSGSIKEVRKGRERNVDTYVDIYAADGDEWYNWAVISQSIASGQNPEQVINSIVTSTPVNGTPPIKFSNDASGLIAGGAAGTQSLLSRGKVKFGLARDYARDWAAKYGYRWSLQNGAFVVVPVTGYRPGEAVVLSSTTGLIGVPEACDGGVRARVLLNPKIQIGCLVQIAPSDLNQITVQQQALKYEIPIATVVTAAGFYRVLVSEVTGDTRGNEWYTDIICVAVDVSAANQGDSVSASG